MIIVYVVFLCLAVYQGADRHLYERDAKKQLNDYCVHFSIVSSEFAGVNLFDFVGLEDFFTMNLIAYELERNAAKLIQRSRAIL